MPNNELIALLYVCEEEVRNMGDANTEVAWGLPQGRNFARNTQTEKENSGQRRNQE